MVTRGAVAGTYCPGLTETVSTVPLRGAGINKKHAARYNRASHVKGATVSGNTVDSFELAVRVIVPEDFSARGGIGAQMAVERS